MRKLGSAADRKVFHGRQRGSANPQGAFEKLACGSVHKNSGRFRNITFYQNQLGNLSPNKKDNPEFIPFSGVAQTRGQSVANIAFPRLNYKSEPKRLSKLALHCRGDHASHQEACNTRPCAEQYSNLMAPEKFQGVSHAPCKRSHIRSSACGIENRAAIIYASTYEQDPWHKHGDCAYQGRLRA